MDFRTRITDAEIVERRYPVRIERFARHRAYGDNGVESGSISIDGCNVGTDDCLILETPGVGGSSYNAA